jgi:hypothetical protein
MAHQEKYYDIQRQHQRHHKDYQAFIDEMLGVKDMPPVDQLPKRSLPKCKRLPHNLLTVVSDKNRLRLDKAFIAEYAKRKKVFGYEDLGYVVYMDHYSRFIELFVSDDGEDITLSSTKEKWHETCERIVNGWLYMLQCHLVHNKIPFDGAVDLMPVGERMYDDIWHCRWLPPGRGMFAMGTANVERRGRGTALFNVCVAFMMSSVVYVVWMFANSLLLYTVWFREYDHDGQGPQRSLRVGHGCADAGRRRRRRHARCRLRASHLHAK